MSVRTTVKTSAARFKSDDRLKAVLAAGVREIGAPLAPPRIPAQPGGLREPPYAARLLDALDTERDLRNLVLSPESGLPCEALEKLADASEKYNTNQFWFEQCKARGYTHPYFLTPSDGQSWDKQSWDKRGHTWREHFVYWCANIDAVIAADAAEGDGFTALLVASSEGHLDVVQPLLAAGADVNLADSDGWTALTYASSEGHLAIVKALLAAGANVNAADGDGFTALLAASSEGHLAVVQALLAAGANVNLADHDGFTALIHASQKGHLALLWLLVLLGADVNAVTTATPASDHKDGYTALMFAISQGHLAIVQALLDAGADVNLADSDGDTALTYASREGHLDIVQALRSAGAR